MSRGRPVLLAGAFKTSLGWCAAAWTPRGLLALVLPRPKRSSALRGLPKQWVSGRLAPVPREYRDAVQRALSGRPTRRPRLDLQGLTPFQRKVLRVTAAIPRGKTRSYGEVAARCGRPKAARAVGGALHRNPLPLFLPCHRVTASRGHLGGFSAGSAMKRRLLALERRRPL